MGFVLWAAGGVASGLGILLLLPVAAMALLAYHRDAFFTAALASCAVLLQQLLVNLDADGNCPAGQLLPSSEWRIHCDILRAFPACEAVVHVHSTHATALACLGQEIPPFHYMVAMAGGARIPCADYATFGTPELSANVLRALDGGLRACLMANHGQVAAGKSLADALALAEEVENLARQYILARSLGPTRDLPAEEMDEVLRRFRHYGQQRRTE